MFFLLLFIRYNSSYIKNKIYLVNSRYYDYYANKLNPLFINEIAKLNRNSSQKNIKKFLDRFGTHIITSANYGSSVDIVYKYYATGRMLKAEYSSRLSFNDSFTMNYENIDIDFKSISNYLMDNSLAYESYDNSIIYRSFGRGISTQISNTELKIGKIMRAKMAIHVLAILQTD